MLLKTKASPQKERDENKRELKQYTCFLYLFLKKEKKDENSMFSSLLYE
jgi:hypothetical protein